MSPPDDQEHQADYGDEAVEQPAEQVLGYGNKAVEQVVLAAQASKKKQSIRQIAKAQQAVTRARARAGWIESTDRFEQDQAQYIDQMFAEPSPIQKFLQKAMQTTTLAETNKDGKLRVRDDEDYIRSYKDHNTEGGTDSDIQKRAKDTSGFTDKRTGEIFLHRRENTGATVEAAVHEGIHLLAHPPGATNYRNAGTFRDQYVGEFDEGVTQYFTELILFEQGFRPWKIGTFDNYLPAVERLIGWLGIEGNEIMADAYFNGNWKKLRNAMQKIWGEQVVLDWLKLLKAKKYKEAEEFLENSPQNP